MSIGRGEARGRPHWTRAEVRSPVAHVMLVEVDEERFIDTSLCLAGVYHLDLSLTPRPPETRMRFTERWPAHRFEATGTLFMVPPGEAFRVRSEACRLGLVVCNLAMDRLAAIFERDFEWTDRRLAQSVDIADNALRRLMIEIGREVAAPGMGSDVLIEAMAMQVAVLLGRRFGDQFGGEKRGGLASWQLRRIDEALREADRLFGLTELAGLCGLSARHLARAYRASRGRSLGSDVAARRLERAVRLLDEGRSVTDVSEALGFSTPSNFCVAFRRSLGESPARHRRDRTAGGL